MKQTHMAYYWLVLCQPDIEELITIFREHLHHVEIVVDGQPLTKYQQAEDLAQGPRLQSLVLCGDEQVVEDVGGELTFRPIVLTMKQTGASLSYWQATGQKQAQSVGEKISALLRKRQRKIALFTNHAAAILLVGNPIQGTFALFSWPGSFILHLIMYIVTILYALICLFILFGILSLLRLTRTTFLFPHKQSASIHYGLFQSTVTFVLAIILTTLNNIFIVHMLRLIIQLLVKT